MAKYYEKRYRILPNFHYVLCMTSCCCLQIIKIQKFKSEFRMKLKKKMPSSIISKLQYLRLLIRAVVVISRCHLHVLFSFTLSVVRILFLLLCTLFDLFVLFLVHLRSFLAQGGRLRLGIRSEKLKTKISIFQKWYFKKISSVLQICLGQKIKIKRRSHFFFPCFGCSSSESSLEEASDSSVSESSSPFVNAGFCPSAAF